MAAGFKDALTAVGATTAEDAEGQYATRQRLVQVAELARQEAALHAPATDDRDAGAQALADYIVGLRTILNRETDLDLDQLPLPVEVEEVQRVAQEHAAESRGALQEARGALVGPEEELARLQAELATVSARHEDSAERVQKLQRQLTDAVATTSNEELEAAIQVAQSLFPNRKEPSLVWNRSGPTKPCLNWKLALDALRGLSRTGVRNVPL